MVATIQDQTVLLIRLYGYLKVKLGLKHFEMNSLKEFQLVPSTHLQFEPNESGIAQWSKPQIRGPVKGWNLDGNVVLNLEIPSAILLFNYSLANPVAFRINLLRIPGDTSRSHPGPTTNTCLHVCRDNGCINQ